ncbi:MAG: hypothetical protein JWP72_2716 [Massilia sp.]|nr:hypothetical protein [Massilia sp.]MDB5790785.1 hypothetical protein [Massilia sp.]
MIRSPLRAGIALACALSLSACGGGDGDIYIGGQAIGVTKPGLVLTNNGGSDLAVNQSGSFLFKDLVQTDDRYFVEVKSVPANVEPGGCVVANATGRAVFNVSNVLVTCTIRKWTLGGTIVGLGNRTGLVLVNGTDRIEIAPNATTFQMAPVSEESPYGVTVLPPKQGEVGPNCAVENGTGTMQAGNVANIVVRCTP